MVLPETYTELFGLGTKPADWKIDPPSIETLKTQLKEQTGRIAERLSSRLNDTLATPFKAGTPYEMNTYEQVLTFSLYHEGAHTGTIKGLLKAVQA